MTLGRSGGGRRLLVLTGTVGGCLLSALIGAVFVRLMLDALDNQPYDGERTEHAYVLVAVSALVIWLGGTTLSIVIGRRRMRADRASDLR